MLLVSFSSVSPPPISPLFPYTTLFRSVTTSATLGDLYDLKDNRRDAAFSIYYMGVNIGGLIGPLLTSAVWGWKGFHWGFGLAAVLMAIGLVQYMLMRRHTVTEESSKPTNPLSRHRKTLV